MNMKRRRKIKAGHMITNKDTAVHTHNACNKTFRKKLYLRLHIKSENGLTAMKQSTKRQTLQSATHKFCHNVKSIQDFFVYFKICYTFFTYSARVHHKEMCRDKKLFELTEYEIICCSTGFKKNIKHNTRQINYVRAKY